MNSTFTQTTIKTHFAQHFVNNNHISIDFAVIVIASEDILNGRHLIRYDTNRRQLSPRVSQRDQQPVGRTTGLPVPLPLDQ